MSQDKVFLWHDEVRRRLREWADWSRGNQLVRGTRHVLAAMMQRAAGEIPGSDASSYDFTDDIHAVDRAVAQMRVQARALGGRPGALMKVNKYVLMSIYMGQRTTSEVAETLNKSEDYVRSRLSDAETFVGSKIPEMEEHLKRREKLNRVRRV